MVSSADRLIVQHSVKADSGRPLWFNDDMFPDRTSVVVTVRCFGRAGVVDRGDLGRTELVARQRRPNCRQRRQKPKVSCDFA